MEGNKKVVRVSKLGQPSMMDPTAKVENTVESMTVEQYEHELVMKECQQVRTRASRRQPCRGVSVTQSLWTALVPSSLLIWHNDCLWLQYLVSTAMAAGFLHTYLGFIQPLVITAIFGPYTATSKPMFRVHVLGGASLRVLRAFLLAQLRWLPLSWRPQHRGSSQPSVRPLAAVGCGGLVLTSLCMTLTLDRAG